jgi:hypothetical protein
MGRYAASTNNTMLDPDPKLMRQADDWTLGRRLTVRHIVQRRLRLMMRQGGCR